MRQEPARTVADPITAYVPGENTQVSRMTDVHPMIQEKYLGSLGVDFLHQEPPRTVGDPFTAYVPEEVSQVSRMTDVNHSMILEKSPR